MPTNVPLDRTAGGCAAEPPVLVALLKAPWPGSVKTRLAAAIGVEAAAAIYRRLVEHQMAAVPPRWPVEVHFAPAEARDEMRAWLGNAATFVPQVNGDLGNRLIAATDGAFRRGATRLLVVGGDCPGLGASILEDAAERLCESDMVIGPAVDGGYYLLGLRTPQPSLFQAIPWSTPAVFPATLAQARASRLSVAILRELEDVDDIASWERAEPLLGPRAAKLPPSI